MPWTGIQMTEFERLVGLANSHFARFKKSSLKDLIALLKTNPLPSGEAIRKAVADLPSDKRDNKYNAAMNYLMVNYPGYDEVVAGGFIYKGFANTMDRANRLARAQLGVSRCHNLVKLCQTTLTKVIANTATSTSPGNWSPEQRKATELFQKWFDDKRAYKSLDRVRGVFARMEASLRLQNWEIVLYGTPEEPDPDGMGGAIPNAFAFVVPDEAAYRIYLGAIFWTEGATRIDAPVVAHAKSASTPDEWQQEKKLKTAMDAAIVTTLHELCHVRAISGGPDITDVPPDPYGLGTCKANAKNAPNLALTNAENYAQFASALLMSQHFF